MSALFALHPHGFSLITFVQHLFFDSVASCGGYYAATFCKHRWHRIVVGITFTLITTFALVSLIG